MTGNEDEIGRDDALSMREAVIRGETRSRRDTGMVWKILGGLAFMVLAALILFPGQVTDLFRLGTSHTEEFQSTDTGDGWSVSTDMSTPQTAETSTTAELPVAAPETAPAGDTGELDALRRRLAELEAAAAAAGDLEGALARQREDLTAEFQRRLEEERMRMQAELAALQTPVDYSNTEEEEARRRLEEERARRMAIESEQVRSAGLVYDQDGGTSVGGRTGVSGRTGAGASGGPTRQATANESFMRDTSAMTHETVAAGAIPDPARTIVQGTVIEAVLQTAVSSEMPGITRASTTVPVYSFDGTTVLLPTGTQLIGSYNSDLSIAQGRLQMIWTRAVTPDGVSVALGGIGGDELGRSGQTGFVDTRFAERFGSAALISIIGAAPYLASDDSSDRGARVIEDVADDFRDTTESVLDDYLSLPPVIYIDQGTELAIMVNRDLVF